MHAASKRRLFTVDPASTSKKAEGEVYRMAIIIVTYLHFYLPQKTTDQDACNICGNTFVEGEEQQWAGCNNCDRWYHRDCAGNPPIRKKWRCQSCT